MLSNELKLKQASVVLGTPPKELQNLVQFQVVRPRKRGRTYWFDQNTLLQAKCALYLKQSLGACLSNRNTLLVGRLRRRKRQ